MANLRTMIRALLYGANYGVTCGTHARVLRETDAAAAEARALSSQLRELSKEADPLSVLIRNMQSARRNGHAAGNGRFPPGRGG